MYELSWRTVSALTRVLFWYLFPSLLRNSGNKHQNNPLVSAETIRHSSTYIILYLFQGLVGCFLFLEFYSSASSCHYEQYAHIISFLLYQLYR